MRTLVAALTLILTAQSAFAQTTFVPAPLRAQHRPATLFTVPGPPSGLAIDGAAIGQPLLRRKSHYQAQGRGPHKRSALVPIASIVMGAALGLAYGPMAGAVVCIYGNCPLSRGAQVGWLAGPIVGGAIGAWYASR
jgi:hypothetical protein